MLLFASFCLNVALVIVAAHRFSKPISTSSAPPARALVAGAPSFPAGETNAAAAISYATNRFHWRLIESPNYDEYVANLRAVGCPERTVRDIIVADVKQHYSAASRERELSQPFWIAGRKRTEAERRNRAQSEAMDKERVELIRRLLGIEICEGKDLMSPDHLEEQALARFLLGPMSEEHLQTLVVIASKYEKRENDLRSRFQGITTDEDELEIGKLGGSLGRELAGVLSPVEFEEMAARLSGAKDLFGGKNKLQGIVQLTPAELRAICLERARAHEFATFFDFERAETTEESVARESVFTNSVARLLGPERFADYVRAEDGEFRGVFEFTKENNLPKSTAVAVYEMRTLAETEARQIREDAALDDAARRQRLEEIQSQVQTAVSSALGETVFERFLGHGGAWVTNATSL